MTETAQPKASTGRLERMDIARGVGILLVVLGHNSVCAKGTFAYPLIFSFHIPLFFFLSGFFHKRRDRLSSDMHLRARRLLIPYFLTGFLFILYKILQNPPGFYSRDLWQLLSGMAWGTGGSGTPMSFLYWPPVWFLTSLFITQVCFSFLQPRLEKQPWLVRVGIFTVVLLLGIHHLDHWGRIYFPGTKMVPNETGLPWNIDLLPATLFYYWMGWETRGRQWLETGLKQQGGIPALLVAAVLFTTYHLAQSILGLDIWTLDLNMRDYGHVIMTTAGAVLGILVVLAGSEWLEQHAHIVIRRILVMLGMQSLAILVFHYFFQEETQQLLSHMVPGREWLSAGGAWIAGIAVPVLLNTFLLRRTPWIRSAYGNPEPLKK